MKIVQVLPCLAYGDAIGNDVLALYDALRECGYETQIYAEAIDDRLPSGTAKTMNDFPLLSERDILIYHLAIGWKYLHIIEKQICKKIAIYHNVTPPEFYRDYNRDAYVACKEGLKEVEYLKDKFDYCLADSEFNKQDLLKMGYKCKVDVLPILIAFDDYKKEPARSIVEKYDDEYVNIIFVGRVVPNKRHENIIKTFYYYKKYYNSKARLFLVGSYNEKELYYKRLKEYVEKLGVEDVLFPGHIKFNEMLAYYKIANVFVCMSEHEGFCVPLVEAMVFDIPIVAFDSCAIKYTLGAGGFLLKNNNPLEAAGVVDRVVKSKALQKQLIENQRKRLKDFSREKIKQQFVEYLQHFIQDA